MGAIPCPYLPESSSPSSSQSNYQFLLLNDRAQGDQPPSGIESIFLFLIQLGVQFIRLVNIAPQASSISLVTIDAPCPQTNQTTGNQTEGQSHGSQGQQPGNQTQQSVIVSDLPFLQSSTYYTSFHINYSRRLCRTSSRNFTSTTCSLLPRRKDSSG